ELLKHLIKNNGWYQALVFSRTKHGANKLVKQLEDDGIHAAAIHGNKSQSHRTKVLESFKDGKLQILVATDIAARGIDIDQLPQVVNYDLPQVPEDYVHRIGRTGRAGANGHAISLVCAEENKMLRDIERLLKKPIDRIELEGFKSTEDFSKPAPSPQRASQGRRDGQGRGQGRNGQGRDGQGRDGQRREGQGRARQAGTNGQTRDSQGRTGQARDSQPRDGQPRAQSGNRLDAQPANGNRAPGQRTADGARSPRDRAPSEQRRSRPQSSSAAIAPGVVLLRRS